MMPVVTVLTIDGGAEAAPALLAFTARLRAHHVRRGAAAAALRAALAVAVPIVLSAWLLPSAAVWLLLGLVVWTTVAALVGAGRGRSLADVALLQLADGSSELDARTLARLGDELATWLEAQRRGEATAMVDWLARDVQRQLPQLAPATLQQLGRRPLGGLLWLLPVLVVLLLLWLLSLWLAPPWRGAFGGAPTPPPAVSGDHDGGGEPQGGGGGQSSPPQQPEPQPQRPDRQDVPPSPPEQPQPEPVPPAEPPPLLELPEQQRFLVPEFIADGPSRRVRMHAAELEQGPPPAANAPSSTGGEAPPTERSAPEQFERAAEQALRARHVPPAEQAMVRRFFAALREAGTK